MVIRPSFIARALNILFKEAVACIVFFKRKAITKNVMIVNSPITPVIIAVISIVGFE